MIYLDNSATTYPKPMLVKNRMMQSFTNFGANPGRSGYSMSIKTGEEVFACRNDISDFFHADGPECVVFQPSCTQAINTVLKGLLRDGDHVVVSDLEHNAVMRPLKKLTKSGIGYTVAATCPGDNDRTVASFRKAITPLTKLVVCTHASNVFGIRLPIARIAALAHFYGAKICVDCAQTAGIVPIDIEDDKIDYLCSAGHKGLYGPMGTGILLLRSGDSLETLIEGGTGTQSRELNQPQEPPERYESGTQNISGISGLRAGIRFVNGKGIKNIYVKEMNLIQYLYDRLKEMGGVQLYTERPDLWHYVPVLSFNLRGVHSEMVGEYLAGRNIAVRCGFHCAPAAHDKMGTTEGTVRVSPSVFTSKNDIDILLGQIRGFRRPK